MDRPARRAVHGDVRGLRDGPRRPRHGRPLERLRAGRDPRDDPARRVRVHDRVHAAPAARRRPADGAQRPAPSPRNRPAPATSVRCGRSSGAWRCSRSSRRDSAPLRSPSRSRSATATRPRAPGIGVFHSISAFNNAGFDLMGGFDSMGGFASDPLVLVPLAVLIVLGGLGFAIVGDIAREARLDPPRARDEARCGDDDRPDRRRDARPAPVRVVEPRDARRVAAAPASAQRAVRVDRVPLGRDERRSRSASSPARACSSGIALMFIGTASGSTGGGIKLTTFSILLASIVSTSSAARTPRRSAGVCRRSSSIARCPSRCCRSRSCSAITLLLQVTTRADDILPIAFETVSAFGTVGALDRDHADAVGHLAAGAHRHDVRRTPRAAHLRPRPRGAYPARSGSGPRSRRSGSADTKELA